MSDRLTDEEVSDITGHDDSVIAGMATELLALRRLSDVAKHPDYDGVAGWMLSKSLATGHGDTIADMLDEAERQIAEAMRAKCETIARERFTVEPDCWPIVRDIAALKLKL